MEKLICSNCGEEIFDDNYTEIDGEIYCQSCVDELFEYCEDCETYVEAGTLTETSDGKFVCEDCLDKNYTLCDECGEYCPYDEVTYLDNYNKNVCEDCLSDTYRECNHCGEIIHEDDSYCGADDEPYCEDCYNEYFVECSVCGELMWRDDAYYNDDDGEWYCEYHYDECRDDDCDGVIYSYHSRSVSYIPKYHNEQDKTEHFKDLYGLELEIGGDTYCAGEFQDIMGSNVVLMHDGSVDGFEMVSMPITREYFYKDFVPTLKKGLTHLLSEGCKGHNEGGIHVHFKQLDGGMQVANMARILYGDDKDKKIWLKITQRRPSAMHWCSMDSNIYSFDEIIDRNLKAPTGEYDYHGTALNYDTRTCTHELRIFNSNLRLERVIKNMECVFALQDYVTRASELVCDTRGFIAFVDEHAKDYPYLADYLHEKNIFEIANKFYGDEYASEPNNVDLMTDKVEDALDTDTSVDDSINEMFG